MPRSAGEARRWGTTTKGAPWTSVEPSSRVMRARSMWYPSGIRAGTTKEAWPVRTPETSRGGVKSSPWASARAPPFSSSTSTVTPAPWGRWTATRDSRSSLTTVQAGRVSRQGLIRASSSARRADGSFDASTPRDARILMSVRSETITLLPSNPQYSVATPHASASSHNSVRSGAFSFIRPPRFRPSSSIGTLPILPDCATDCSPGAAPDRRRGRVPPCGPPRGERLPSG